MRYWWLGAVLGIMVMGIIPAEAEMYKYRDEHGNVCFTDNLAQIPPDQRPKAVSMEAVEARGTTTSPEVENTDTAEGDTEAADEAQAPDIVVDQETIEALNQRKKELDEEFSGLMAEKYVLLQEKEKLAGLAGRDVKAREAYEGKVTSLNKRIADYTQRRDAFQKECADVKQALEPSSPEQQDSETLLE